MFNNLNLFTDTDNSPIVRSGVGVGNIAAQSASANVFAQHNTPDSRIMFPVGLRNLTWETRNGGHERFNSHRALIRLNDAGDQADVLNVVSNTYKLVHNRELFQQVEATLMRELPESALANVKVKDKLAYNGRSCWREYVFPGLASDIGAKSQVAFRVIVQNGYGGSALRVLAGAIEFWCSNGMIRGSYEQTYHRHSSGLQIGNLNKTLEKAIDTYATSVKEWREWTRKQVTREQTMALFQAIASSPTQFDKLTDRWATEREERGSTLWSVYSAMTYYASHNTGAFAVRNTKNDNADAVMMRRELEVAAWTKDPAFVALIDA